MSGLTIPSPFAKHGLLYISSGLSGRRHTPGLRHPPRRIGRHLSMARRREFRGSLPGAEKHVRRYRLVLPAGSVPTILPRSSTAITTTRCSIAASFSATTAKTGEEIYGRKRLEIGNGFTASPWAYNGKIFLLSEDGDTYVVQAGPEFKVIGKNSLDEMIAGNTRRLCAEA